MQTATLTFDKSSIDVLLAKALTNAKRKPPAKAGAPGPLPPRRTSMAGNPTIEVEFPVAEAIARALSQHPTKAAVKALASFLKDRTQRPSTRASSHCISPAYPWSSQPRKRSAARPGSAGEIPTRSKPRPRPTAFTRSVKLGVNEGSHGLGCGASNQGGSAAWGASKSSGLGLHDRLLDRPF